MVGVNLVRTAAHKAKETSMSVPTPDPTDSSPGAPSSLRSVILVIAGLATVGLWGCDNPLDVDNPNNLAEEDLDQPSAVRPLVNGAQGTVSRTLNSMLAIYSAGSDELRGVGSFDAWRNLSQGGIDDPQNQFTDDRFGLMAEARYIADLALERAERFDREGTIPNRTELARAYLYGGIVYTAIPDLFEDFVLPTEPTEAVPAVGEDQMISLYDTAVSRLTRGLEVARAEGAATWERRLLAQRARTHHARGVWAKLNPPGEVPSDPLVESQEAADDAREALDLIGPGADWTYDFTFTPASSEGIVNSFAAYQINQRGALAIGTGYAESEEGNPSRVTEVTLTDPIDDVPDPRLVDRLDVVLSGQFAPFTVVSARELHLILAEHHLAQGDESEFTDEINAIRVDLDDMTAYDDQIPAQEMLHHERRVNLFMHVRRLHDMYRFGATSDLWLTQSAAATRPGTVFPIGISEIQSNPQVGG